MGQAIHQSSSDAWVDQDDPQNNHGQAAKLKVKGASSHKKNALIHFHRPFPIGATVVSAVIRVYAAGTWTGSQAVFATRIVDKWKEHRVKWANAPSDTATNDATNTVTSLTDGDQIEFDVTAMMNDVSAGADYFGVYITTDASGDRLLYSTENPKAAKRPEMEISWVVDPDQPVNLKPQGGLSVNPGKPHLSWQFSDKFLQDGVEQASSRVQIASDATFGAFTILYDTGKVANSLSHWDTATAGAVHDALPLADNTTFYWRVMTWDEADQPSDWSDAAQFVRRSYGVLTITNPGSVVHDLTPPISWTFTGRTQEAFEMQLLTINDKGVHVEVFREPRAADTDNSFTLPVGLLNSRDLFKVRLKVWDDQDRMGIRNAPAYVEAEQAFTYVRDGTPDPVTSLVANPDHARQVLNFHRDDEPDFFCLKVDDLEVDTRIDPADCALGGGDYALEYWGAFPRVEHQYEVEAVVHSGGIFKHSAGNPTVIAETDPIGITLVDPSDGTFVYLTGPDTDLALGIREVGTTYDILGARAPVRITDAMMGYAGSFSGAARTKDARDAFLDLKGRLVPLRLIAGDLNIKVYLEEADSAVPTYLHGDRVWHISANVFQIDAHNTFEVAGGN